MPVLAFNVEALRDQFLRPGFAGSLDNHFQNSSGNNDLWSNSTQLQMQNNSQSFYGQIPKNSLFLISSLDFGERNGAKTINRGQSHLRYTHMLSKRSGFEAFTQYQFNFFQSLEARYLYGVNYRHNLFLKDSFRLTAGVGVMSDMEEFKAQPRSQVIHTERLNSYLNITWACSETLELVATTYYQPKIQNPKDRRWFMDVDIIAKINSHFDFIFALDILYDSLPQEGVRTTDTLISQKLRWKF